MNELREPVQEVKFEDYQLISLWHLFLKFSPPPENIDAASLELCREIYMHALGAMLSVCQKLDKETQHDHNRRKHVMELFQTQLEQLYLMDGRRTKGLHG